MKNFRGAIGIFHPEIVRQSSGKGVISGVSRSMEVQTVLLFFAVFEWLDDWGGCWVVLLGVFLEEFSKLCLVYFSNSQLGGGFKYLICFPDPWGDDGLKPQTRQSEKHLSVLGAWSCHHLNQSSNV